MYLFILESIGTSELLLIGIVALIFLGPRKMPEMARKIGKLMSEFRNTTNEFKETWQREANFEEEKKAFDLKALEAETDARVESIPNAEATEIPAAPAIKAIDPADFKQIPQKQIPQIKSDNAEKSAAAADITNDKKNWL